MNFNYLFLLFLIFFTLSSCGVKSPPLQYPETSIDSYISGYTGVKEPPTATTSEEVQK